MTEQQLNQQLAHFFGQLTAHFDSQLQPIRDDLQSLKGNMNHLQNTVDRIAGQMETVETEQAVVTHQLDRHGRWITQLSEATNTKLVPEQ